MRLNEFVFHFVVLNSNLKLPVNIYECIFDGFDFVFAIEKIYIILLPLLFDKTKVFNFLDVGIVYWIFCLPFIIQNGFIQLTYFIILFLDYLFQICYFFQLLFENWIEIDIFGIL